MCVTIADHAVGSDEVKTSIGLTAGADDDLSDTLCRVCHTMRVLRGEAFVNMGVAIDDEVCASVIEHLPERLYL